MDIGIEEIFNNIKRQTEEKCNRSLRRKNEKRKEAESSSDEETRKESEFNYKIKQFIDISNQFSSPLKKTASYICENELVSFPRKYSFEFKKGDITTKHIKFSNLTLEPVYLRLYKLIPDAEQFKFINLSLNKTKRLPPGLSFNLGLIYDGIGNKIVKNVKLILVATRKTFTPCYQICEIDLDMCIKKLKQLNLRT